MSYQTNVRAGGFSLVEVMITVLILVLGLLGLAGMQARALNAEAESFARAQALVLLQDMADRIASNRVNAKLGTTSEYATDTVFGAGNADQDCSALTTATPAEVALKDLCEWDLSLKGATQDIGGSAVSVLSGGVGCIAYSTSPIPAFVVTIAWQGRGAIGALPDDVTCGDDVIAGDQRRAVTITVPLPNLQG